MSGSDYYSDEEIDEKPTVSKGNIEVVKPTGQGKKTTQKTVKESAIGSPGRARPPKKASRKPITGSTNASMGPRVVKLALTLLKPEHFDALADELGVDKGKLKDSWRKNWVTRVHHALDVEFNQNAAK